MWYLSAVLNNSICLVDSLFSDVEALRRSKEAGGLGYKHWFQNEYGNVLINEGLRIAVAELMQKSAMTITRFMRNKRRVNTVSTSSQVWDDR